MSFGLSIGDIILCTQIAHRLFSSLTKGRTKAPHDLKELEDALFGLCCALDLLQKEHEAIVARAASKPNIVAVQTNQHLGYMITSCQETLEELDNATAKFREAADDSPLPAPHRQYMISIVPLSRRFRAKIKVQWKRISWDLQGDTIAKYRQKLQCHTNSINLILSTFIWSATERIEEEGKHHTHKLNTLLDQTSQFNKNIHQLAQSLQTPILTAQLHHESMTQYAARPTEP